MTEAVLDLAGVFHEQQRAALKACAALEAAGIGRSRIYDAVPVGAGLPYLVTGDDQFLFERTGACGDEGEIFATVHAWTKGPEVMACRAILAAARTALAAELPLPGVGVVDTFEVVTEQYSTDPDQSTHGVLTIHYLVSLET